MAFSDFEGSRLERGKRIATRGMGIGALVLTLIAASCSFHSVQPNAGEEAVLIDKPMIFGHGGVQSTSVKTGRSYIWRTTDYVIVNTQPIKKDIEFQDLMTSDGVPIDFHAIMRFRVVDSVSLIKNFGPNWYETNLEPEFRNLMRQAVRKHGMNETAIDTSAIAAIDNEVFVALSNYVRTSKLPILLLQVSAGRANPPDAIKSQRIETAAQEQRVRTMQQMKLAEDARLAAEESRARADNAYRQQMGLSPELYVQLEAIKAQKEMCSRTTCTFVMPGLGGSPLISIK